MLALLGVVCLPHAGADTFVDVPLAGLEPGWQFAAMRWSGSPSSEVQGTRRNGVVFDPTFFAERGAPPAVYGQGSATDYVYIRHSGWLRITLAGQYRFSLGSDDGSHLIIDQQVVRPVRSPHRAPHDPQVVTYSVQLALWQARGRGTFALP